MNAKIGAGLRWLEYYNIEKSDSSYSILINFRIQLKIILGNFFPFLNFHEVSWFQQNHETLCHF